MIGHGPKNCIEFLRLHNKAFTCSVGDWWLLIVSQEFSPNVGRYNVIWIQWCIGHLADDDFISFFNRAKVNLTLYCSYTKVSVYLSMAVCCRCYHGRFMLLILLHLPVQFYVVIPVGSMFLSCLFMVHWYPFHMNQVGLKPGGFFVLKENVARNGTA